VYASAAKEADDGASEIASAIINLKGVGMVITWKFCDASRAALRDRSLSLRKAATDSSCRLGSGARLTDLFRRTEGSVKGCKQGARLGAGDGVPDGLTVTARRHEAILAQEREMLRDAGIADTEKLGKFSDRPLPLHELAENEQPVPVGHRLEEIGGAFCRTVHELRI
jgi:hypothetical protein